MQINDTIPSVKDFIIENWDNIKYTVRTEYELSDVSYNTWILPLIFHDVIEKNVIIIVPYNNTNALKYMTSNYTLFFKVTISEMVKSDIEISFILEKDKDKGETFVSESVVKNISYENTNLNHHYLFDTFIVGSNNRFAHSAALAVAESPTSTYNPLYIYSGAGLGKTHLIHSIGHFILKNNPETKVLYVTSEEFTNEVIASIRSGNAAKMTQLREKYRTVDVLLLDDVQFIIGKESTQEEFFHTFNALHSSGKQIILTSDKPPKDLETLEERLRTRFTWGLLADMQPPDYETRVAILQKYAERHNKKVNTMVIEYIAKNVTSNIRELEGALNKILAFKILEKQDLNIKDIEESLKDIIYDNEKREVTPKLIINIVCEYYDVNPIDITSKKKNSEFIQPRQVIMYLCREFTNYSYKEIANFLGKRDHSTIIHGDKKIKEEILVNDDLKNKIEKIKKVIRPA